MDPFHLITKYFWIFALATGLQHLRRSPDLRERLASDEAFAEKHRTVRGWLFVWSSLPWLIAGAGQLTDQVPSIWYYLRPQDGNPYVLAFWVCIIGLQIVVAAWVYLGDGAATIAEHRLVTLHVFWQRVTVSESCTKVLVGLMLVASISGLITMAMSNVPIPRITS